MLNSAAVTLRISANVLKWQRFTVTISADVLNSEAATPRGVSKFAEIVGFHADVLSHRDRDRVMAAALVDSGDDVPAGLQRPLGLDTLAVDAPARIR